MLSQAPITQEAELVGDGNVLLADGRSSNLLYTHVHPDAIPTKELLTSGSGKHIITVASPDQSVLAQAYFLSSSEQLAQADPSSLHQSPHRQRELPEEGRAAKELEERLHEVEQSQALGLGRQQSSEKTRNTGKGTGVRTPIFVQRPIEAGKGRRRNPDPLSSNEQSVGHLPSSSNRTTPQSSVLLAKKRFSKNYHEERYEDKARKQRPAENSQRNKMTLESQGRQVSTAGNSNIPSHRAGAGGPMSKVQYRFQQGEGALGRHGGVSIQSADRLIIYVNERPFVTQGQHAAVGAGGLALQDAARSKKTESLDKRRKQAQPRQDFHMTAQWASSQPGPSGWRAFEQKRTASKRLNSYGANLPKHFYRGNPDVKPHIEASQQGWAEAYLSATVNKRATFGPTAVAVNQDLKAKGKRSKSGATRRKSQHRRGTSYHMRSRAQGSNLEPSAKAITVELIPERKDARLAQGGHILLKKGTDPAGQREPAIVDSGSPLRQGNESLYKPTTSPVKSAPSPVVMPPATLPDDPAPESFGCSPTFAAAKKSVSGFLGHESPHRLGLRSSSLSGNNSLKRGYMVNDTEVDRALQFQRPVTALDELDSALEQNDIIQGLEEASPSQQLAQTQAAVVVPQARLLQSKPNKGLTQQLKRKRRHARPASGCNHAFDRHMSLTNTDDQSVGYNSYFIDGTKSALEQAKMASYVESKDASNRHQRELVPADYSEHRGGCSAINRTHSLYQTQNMSQYTSELMRKKQDAVEQLRNQQQFVYANTLEATNAHQQQQDEAQSQLLRRREVIRVLRGQKQQQQGPNYRILHTAQHRHNEDALIRPSSGTTISVNSLALVPSRSFTHHQQQRTQDGAEVSSAEAAAGEKSVQATRPSVIQYPCPGVVTLDDEIATAMNADIETECFIQEEFAPPTQGTQTGTQTQVLQPAPDQQRWKSRELMLLQRLNLKNIIDNRNAAQTMTAADLFALDGHRRKMYEESVLQYSTQQHQTHNSHSALRSHANANLGMPHTLSQKSLQSTNREVQLQPTYHQLTLEAATTTTKGRKMKRTRPVSGTNIRARARPGTALAPVLQGVVGVNVHNSVAPTQTVPPRSQTAMQRHRPNSPTRSGSPPTNNLPMQQIPPARVLMSLASSLQGKEKPRSSEIVQRLKGLSAKRPSRGEAGDIKQKEGTLRFPQYSLQSEQKYNFNTSLNPNQVAARHDQHRRLHEARILLQALPEAAQQREFARAQKQRQIEVGTQGLMTDGQHNADLAAVNALGPAPLLESFASVRTSPGSGDLHRHAGRQPEPDPFGSMGTFYKRDNRYEIQNVDEHATPMQGYAAPGEYQDLVRPKIMQIAQKVMSPTTQRLSEATNKPFVDDNDPVFMGEYEMLQSRPHQRESEPSRCEDEGPNQVLRAVAVVQGQVAIQEGRRLHSYQMNQLGEEERKVIAGLIKSQRVQVHPHRGSPSREHTAQPQPTAGLSNYLPDASDGSTNDRLRQQLNELTRESNDYLE